MLLSDMTGEAKRTIFRNCSIKIYSFFLARMPKTGLAAHEWERRLRLFALGKFEFSRGHAPPTGSVWAKKRANIQKCPVGKAAVDMFDKKVQCTCGYHPKEVRNKNDVNLLILIIAI